MRSAKDWFKWRNVLSLEVLNVFVPIEINPNTSERACFAAAALASFLLLPVKFKKKRLINCRSKL